MRGKCENNAADSHKWLACKQTQTSMSALASRQQRSGRAACGGSQLTEIAGDAKQLRGKERGPLSGQKLFTCHSAGVAQLWSSLESSFGELKAQKLRNFRRSPDDFFSRRATRKAPRCPSQPRKSKEGKAEKPGVALSGRRKVGNTALAACCLVPRCVCEM